MHFNENKEKSGGQFFFFFFFSELKLKILVTIPVPTLFRWINKNPSRLIRYINGNVKCNKLIIIIAAHYFQLCNLRYKEPFSHVMTSLVASSNCLFLRKQRLFGRKVHYLNIFPNSPPPSPSPELTHSFAFPLF